MATVSSARRGVCLVLGLAVSSWASVARAQLATDVRAAAQRACGSTEEPSSVAGPWRRAEGEFAAALFWREGAERACLTMVLRRAGVVSVVARGELAAGWSERYGERYAPGLRPDAVWLPGRPPLPVTDTTQMGAGGGGGSLTTVWLAARGRWAAAYAQTLDGAVNINTAVETPCEGSRELVQRGGLLVVSSCFDGSVTERRLRFDGRRFVATGAAPRR